MENKIKVTVEYEVPKTNKFDALLAEYAIAKQIADETETYYKPLADLAEAAKLDAILKQIEPIKYYAQQISRLGNDRYPVGIYARHCICHFEVRYDAKSSQPWTVWWAGNSFSKERLIKCRGDFCERNYNILGNWDQWNMYKQLEEYAMAELQKAIDRQKTRGQEQINRLKNIQGDI